MKKIVCILLITALAVSLLACGAPAADSSSAAPGSSEATQQAGGQESGAAGEAAEGSKGIEGKKIKIGWSPPDITNVFKTATDYMEKAVEEANAAGLDVELITRSATEHTDAADQVKTLENFIQNKVDVIIVSPTEVEAIKPALKEINEAGIPIIMVNMLDEQEGIDIANFVGFDNAQAASVSAYSMLDALGGPGVVGEGETVELPEDGMLDLKWWTELYKDVDKESISGKIAMIEGIAGDFFSNERTRGFMEVISQYPNVEVVAQQPADWNRQKAVEAAENIIQNNPDLDAIYASCAEMALGTSIAAESAGRADDLIIISNDGTAETIQAIKDGKIMAETWHGFPEWGWYGVQFAVQLALGEEVPLKYDIRPRTEYIGNADNFYPEPKLEAIDWQAIIDDAK